MDVALDYPEPKLITEPKRNLYTKHWGSLKQIRDRYYPTWVELADFILPFIGIQYEDITTIAQRGDKIQRKRPTIINNKATLASRILINGLAAGLTSQSRPWLRLKQPAGMEDPDYESKRWLEGASKAILWMAATSNYYPAMKMQYRDMVVFGPGLKIIDEHPEKITSCISCPVGSYCLIIDEAGQVCGFMREIIYTVAQMVEKFGYKKCSVDVQTDYDRGDYYLERRVCHVVEQNRMYRGEGYIGAAGMRWASVYYQHGMPDHDNSLLSFKGYYDKPFSAGRWDILAGDTYGSSAGMETLGDIKALQVLEYRKAQAVDKQVTPPTQSPASLSGQRINHLPGANTVVAEVTQKITSLYDVRPDMISLGNEIQRHEQRIDMAFFVDVIQSVTNLTRQNVKAEEIVERREEKIMAISPLLDAMFTDVLDVDVMRMLHIGRRIGLIPAPPAKLAHSKFAIKYTSTLAQAQEAVSVGPIERLFTFAGGLLGVYGESKDVLDPDAAIYAYAEAIGSPSSILVPEQAVMETRQKRAQMAEQQRAMEQTAQGVEAAKNLSEAKLTDPSMLNMLIGGGQ